MLVALVNPVGASSGTGALQDPENRVVAFWRTKSCGDGRGEELIARGAQCDEDKREKGCIRIAHALLVDGGTACCARRDRQRISTLDVSCQCMYES